MNGSDLDPQAARAIEEWVSGIRRTFGRVLFAEAGADVQALADRMGADDALIAPAESGAAPAHGVLVEYTGRLNEVGDELHVLDRSVELRDYIAAALVEITGPTVVRFADIAGWRAFLDDADLARRTGVFPPAMIDPLVQIADRGALLWPFELERPTTVVARADGRLTLGPQGIGLGSVDEIGAALDTPQLRIAALGALASIDELSEDVRLRPWLERYLRAGDLAKVLRLDLGVDRISGFGYRVVDDGRADAEPWADDPVVLSDAGEFVLADLTSLRRQRLGAPTAAVLEIVQTSSTSQLAIGRVAGHLGMAADDAGDLCARAVDQLRVRKGRRVNVPVPVLVDDVA